MRISILLIFIPAIITGCRPATNNYFPSTTSIEVVNPLNETRKNVLVYIPAGIPEKGSFMVSSKEVQLPWQRIDTGIYTIIDSLKPNEKRKIAVYYNENSTDQPTFRKRTQAELSHRIGGEWKNREYVGGTFRNVDYLRVPREHKDHSYFIRYEGPGWESELVGYRLYLDQRNATDVFGKKTNDMILLGVGQDGFDSYHKMQSWGMDIMKVGKSLGLGSLGVWTDTAAVRVEQTDSIVCRISDGNLRSTVTINYWGWKIGRDTVDMKSELWIDAGSRLTHHSVTTQDTIATLCTGIVKDKNAKVFKNEGSRDSFGYIATYGKQSLNGDNLGLVVLFSYHDFGGFHQDSNSHVVTLLPNPYSGHNGISYHFGAAWELEPNGITNENEFIKWVEKSARELANPVLGNDAE